MYSYLWCVLTIIRLSIEYTFTMLLIWSYKCWYYFLYFQSNIKKGLASCKMRCTYFGTEWKYSQTNIFPFFLFHYCCSANCLNNLISCIVIGILAHGVPYYGLEFSTCMMERLLHAIFLSNLSHLCDGTSALLVYFCHSITSHPSLQVKQVDWHKKKWTDPMHNTCLETNP